MKKIGIITLNGNTNFGNRLQNYALQEFLKKSNNYVDTVWFCNIKNYIKERIKNYIFFFINKRKYNFLNFSKKNINTKYYLRNDISKKYDNFIVGSDQVWNYEFPDFNDNMFAKFSNSNKNISYAASFGISKIPEKYINIYKKGLSNIKSISVREDRGKELVEEITGRKDIEVLIDPTMLLTAEEWDKVSKKPKMIKKDKYILNYFLGELSEERKKEIERISKENDCEIINILDENSTYYECGPSEFLYLEKNAFLVCTDSFHSSVFAIIYNTPFLVFDREDKNGNMNSRIETLLSKFHLEDRKYTGKITNKDLKANYSEAYKILEQEREKSRKFLEKALKQED